MLWFWYNVLFAVGFVLLLPRFAWRMMRRGGYGRGFPQRLALYRRSVRERLAARRRVWIHAVSVGEVYVALRFAEEFRRRNPEASFVFTTTTSTGHAVAESRLVADDVLLYFPVDFPAIAGRALRAIDPLAVVLTECEFWPNLVRLGRRRGIPVFLLNGRISASSYRGYRLLPSFARAVLGSLNLCLMQSEEDRRRIVALGARAERTLVLGSAKYDGARIDPTGESRARATLECSGVNHDAAILLGGSTWQGEEEILLRTFVGLRDRWPALRLVLVPRHAERRAEVESAIRRHGLRYVRRTDLTNGRAVRAPVDVVLVDTTGELADLYSCASVIFVGKSLTQHGGQNVIEPALWGKPVVVGPHTENFAAIVADFLDAEAMLRVPDGEALGEAVGRLLADPELCESIGARARRLVQTRQGVVQRSADLVLTALDGREAGSPEGRPASGGPALPRCPPGSSSTAPQSTLR